MHNILVTGKTSAINIKQKQNTRILDLILDIILCIYSAIVNMQEMNCHVEHLYFKYCSQYCSTYFGVHKHVRMHFRKQYFV